MLYSGFQNKREFPNVNQELMELTGFLDDDVAKESLARFLRYNLSFTVRLMSGKKPFALQDMIVRAMFNKDFMLTIAGRGLSKSWTVAMFSWLYALFNPGAKIGIVSGSFRQARIVFEYIEDFVNSPGGQLLRECLNGDICHKNDAWSMQFGRSQITALPLGVGHKLRGFRFNVMVIDELALVPSNIINEIILPFLAVNADPQRRREIYLEESKLIKSGAMKEEDRTDFQKNKFIGLSSASYTYEFLYDLYKEYVEKIYDPDARDQDGKPMDTTGYGVLQFSYKVAPSQFYNNDAIAKFRAQMSEVQFNREFNSVFTDDSGGFFSKKKMDACTIPNGEEPTIEIVGEAGAEYILSIDPSWSKSEASDHFAMNLCKIDRFKKSIVLVHNYAVAGGTFQDHTDYLAYILTHFNIIYIIMDVTGGTWFIDDVNSSSTFAELKLKLNWFEADFENMNYTEGLRNAKRTYSLMNNAICHPQRFSSEWIQTANERLAASFDHRTVKFAARAMDSKFESLMKLNIPINNLMYNIRSKSLDSASGRLADFIEYQGELIDLTKSETALIEVTTSQQGSLKFNLPQNLKRDKKPTRARRDSYTALLMANWAAKCFFDLIDVPKQKNEWIPFFAA